MERSHGVRSRARAIDHAYQRTYKACLSCARTKSKCELGNAAKCRRCSLKGVDCVFSAKKPWARTRDVSIDSSGQDRLLESRAEPAHLFVQPSQPATGNQHNPPGLLPQQVELAAGTNASRIDEAREHEGLSSSVLRRMVSTNKDAFDILFDTPLQQEPNNVAPDASGNRTAIPQLTHADAVRAWSACRFVRMGWFSANDAIQLVDLFFKNMSPLSPILTDFFATRANQFYLITQEPMLCYTILMLSSRHHTLPGPCDRTFFIHNRLWHHCQNLLLRIMLGQEKINKAKTRNLGSIEALMLMAEWYPRALQFPPDSDGWDSDLIMTSPNIHDPPKMNEDIPVSCPLREDVIEPTKRFERMSWMILNSALALAHELGIFESSPRLSRRNGSVEEAPKRYLEHLEHRRQRLPSLIFASINALSSQIGCTSPMPLNAGIIVPGACAVFPQDGDAWPWFMKAWIELINLTTTVTETLFPLMRSCSSTATSDALVSVLERKVILLASWRQRFLDNTEGSSHAVTLFIEYQHLRILLNSVGMQRIVQRVLDQDQRSSPTPSASLNTSATDVYFMERVRGLDLTTRDLVFIEEVIDGCCQTLEKITALEESLQYVPMRIVYRMITSSIFLMKALALGVRNAKLQESLQILDRAITTLQHNSRDDAHLNYRYSVFLKSQVSRLQKSFMSTYPANTTDLRPVSQGYGDMSGIINSGFSELPMDSWLSLPFDPSMAPFALVGGEFDALFNGIDFELDFLGQFTP